VYYQQFRKILSRENVFKLLVCHEIKNCFYETVEMPFYPYLSSAVKFTMHFIMIRRLQFIKKPLRRDELKKKKKWKRKFYIPFPKRIPRLITQTQFIF
jgi:hypothetical protein